MNKALKIGIICLLFWAGQICRAQVQIDTSSVYYYDSFHCAGHYQVSYNIRNDSEESYVTWISRNPIAGKSTREIIFDGIQNRHGGAFSFWDLIAEISTMTGVTYNVPANCMKIIQPGETFTYTIVKPSENSTFYEDRMVLLETKRVDEYFKDKMGWFKRHEMELDHLTYKESNLVLVEQAQTRIAPEPTKVRMVGARSAKLPPDSLKVLEDNLVELMSKSYGWRSKKQLVREICNKGNVEALPELVFAYRDDYDSQLKCALTLIEKWNVYEAYYDAYWITMQKYLKTKEDSYRKKAMEYLFEGAFHEDVKCCQTLADFYKEDFQMGNYFYYLSRKQKNER